MHEREADKAVSDAWRAVSMARAWTETPPGAIGRTLITERTEQGREGSPC